MDGQGRVFAGGYFTKLDLREVTSPLDRDDALSTEVDPSLDTLGIAVLNDERLEPGRKYPDAEAPDFTIPQDSLRLSIRAEGIDRALVDLGSRHAYDSIWRQSSDRGLLSPYCLQNLPFRGDLEATAS